MKKKVLILVNHAITIYFFRMELIKRLVSEGYEVYISAPYSELIDEIIKEDCKFCDIQLERHGTNPVKDYKLILEYRKLIKRISPDIILTYTVKPNVYGGIAASQLKVPFVSNITGLGSAVKGNKLLCDLVMLLYKIAFRKVQTVFFQNEDNMKFFEKRKIAIGKHKLLPGSGVNLQHFAQQDYPGDETTKFVFVSRVMREKGVEEYLQAAIALKKKYPKMQFHICGFCEEAYENTLNDLQAQGIIEYHGMVRDIRTVLKDMHCCVLPSYHEGMSNVLLEAAAVGRPAIATDIPGCREIIKDDSTGFLVNVQDKEDLICKMEQFISLPYEQKQEMGKKARQHVEAVFDRRKVVDAYMKEIYNSERG